MIRQVKRALTTSAFVTATFLTATSASGHAGHHDHLARRGTLGVALAGDPKGVKVAAIIDARSASVFKLRVGDVITAVDGTPPGSPGALGSRVARLDAGAKATLAYIRDGKQHSVSGRLAARPIESFANGTVTLGEVPFEGGYLREILATPKGGANGPVLFLIQGFTCASVETTSPDASHARLIEGLLARGVSTYRIEKPQVGDSRGGADCANIGFKTEVAAFQAGYRALREKHGVAPERVIILGHSLGGLEAPLLAASGPSPRGVAVYGTVLRNWFDYMIDIVKVQPFIASGLDPVEGEEIGERLRPALERIMLRGESPPSVAASSPELAKLMRENLEWDGADHLYGRHYTYFREMAATRLAAAWKDTNSRVLSVYGEADFEAIDDQDHRLIADIANFYRPGSARFVLLPRTSHGMRLEGTPSEARERVKAAAAGQAVPPAPFNTEIVDLFGDWIASVMSAPPLRPAN